MPRFVFQMQSGRSTKLCAIEDVLRDGFAARQAALSICADLAKDIISGLTEDSEWRLNVLDESGKTVWRLRFLAEKPEPNS